MRKVYVAIHNQPQESTKHLSPGQEGLCNLLLCLPTVVCLLGELLVEDKLEDKVPQTDLKHFRGADHQSCNMGWMGKEERGKRAEGRGGREEAEWRGGREEAEGRGGREEAEWRGGREEAEGRGEREEGRDLACHIHTMMYSPGSHEHVKRLLYTLQVQLK